MIAGLRIEHYEWRGGREAMLRRGPDTGAIVVAAPPLFEEANRTRAFLTEIARGLAARGIGSVIPDLPGQGDSMVPTRSMTWAGLRAGFAAATAAAVAGGRAYALAIRSGALIDGEASLAGRWRFAPQDGGDLAREWRRVTDADRLGAIAGNPVAATLLAEAEAPFATTDAPLRTVRLATDPRPADRIVEGPPLWRRSEPGTDAGLAALLADDIARWIDRCEG